MYLTLQTSVNGVSQISYAMDGSLLHVKLAFANFIITIIVTILAIGVYFIFQSVFTSTINDISAILVVYPKRFHCERYTAK